LLDEIADELRRTLSYLSTRGAEAAADSICALGDGAAVRNLAAHLAAKIGISAWNWSLPAANRPSGTTGIPPVLLAVPSSLSSLAWEV
jgi:hypothetical protein